MISKFNLFTWVIDNTSFDLPVWRLTLKWFVGLSPALSILSETILYETLLDCLRLQNPNFVSLYSRVKTNLLF